MMLVSLEPVDKLLSLGPIEGSKPSDWLDYRSMGIGEEHAPELVRMMRDPELNDSESDAISAPIHALRALGQIHPPEFLDDFLEFLNDQTVEFDTDWLHEDAGFVFAQYGPAAIPKLRDYLLNSSIDEYPRMTVVSALVEIAKQLPEAKADCIAAFVSSLEQFDDNGPGQNAVLAGSLADLKAIETYPLIKKVYEAHAADTLIFGDLEDIEFRLGLRDEPSSLRRFAQMRSNPAAPTIDNPYMPPLPKLSTVNPGERDKRKAKRKLAKAARKRNRNR